MPLKAKRGVQVRGRGELIKDSVVRFTCPEGHTFTEDMNRKSLPISKRISPNGVKLLTRYWGNENHAGVIFICKKCK